MALFSLTDIKFKQDTVTSKNPIIDEKYRNNILKYPIDIGEVDKGHYMIIHINVQDRTSYKINRAGGDKPTIFGNRSGTFAQSGYQNLGGFTTDLKTAINRSVETLSDNSDTSQTQTSFGGFLKDAVKNTLGETISSFGSKISENPGVQVITDFASGAFGEVTNRVGEINNENFVRKITRTTDSIALYMPDTLNFSHQQQYSSRSPGSETGAMLAAGTSLLNDAKGDFKKLGQNLTPFISEKLKSLAGKVIGDNTADLFFYSAFGSVNPKMELIYTSPDFRRFSFDFMFYPRSEIEATQVQDIIQRLRFHQAPELDSGTAGFFLVPPSEFDIEFYYNGRINDNIPKISTCVLGSIDIDYAPNGFSAYESPESLGVPKYGSTGMPYAIRMTLSFQETEIMTKYNFQDENQKNTYRRR